MLTDWAGCENAQERKGSLHVESVIKSTVITTGEACPILATAARKIRCRKCQCPLKRKGKSFGDGRETRKWKSYFKKDLKFNSR